MANLSNINNKLVLTTDGAALINQGTVDYGTAKLQVSGNGSTGTITWRNDGGRKTGYLYSDSNGIAIYSTALNNAGIYLADNLRIDFRVNGSERMRIDSSGVISIGPSTTSSEIYFNYNNTNNKGGLKIDYSTGELRLTAGESGNGYHQAFYTNGAERMRIDSSGKILLNNSSYNFIGTNTSDGSNTQRIYIGAGNDATATQGGLVSVYGNETSSASEQGQVSLIAGRKSTGNIRFWTGEATTIERMTILSGGNVGIGETSPSDKLQIGQGHSILVGDYFQLGSGSASIMGALGWNRDTTNGVIYNTNFGAFQMHNNEGKLCLQGYNSNGANQFQHEFYNNGDIYFEGNVLIGTTSIENPRGLAQALEIEAGSPVGIILNDSRDTHPMGIENAGAVMNFTYNTSPLMTILAGGNVGINTTSPLNKLQVNGDIGIGELNNTRSTNVRFAKNDVNVITFDISVAAIGAWRPGSCWIQVSGSQNGLQEYWSAWYFIRLTHYYLSGVAGQGTTNPSCILDSGGDTSQVIVGVSSTNSSNPQIITITLTDSGGTTNSMVADINCTMQVGINSIT
jgi:hypothetical protein